jgi:hypothetical protein
LLEEHDLTRAMFECINGLMESKGLLLRSGTIVDATIIAAAMFQKPAEDLGFWRRKLSSMIIPLASIAESAKWEEGMIMSAVARGTISMAGKQIPALIVVVSEKENDK